MMSEPLRPCKYDIGIAIDGERVDFTDLNPEPIFIPYDAVISNKIKIIGEKGCSTTRFTNG